MKYLVLFAVLLLVYAVWRSGRARQASKGSVPPPGGPGLPQDMVRCPVCALHLPRGDALPGPGGNFYCSAEHRLRAGEKP